MDIIEKILKEIDTTKMVTKFVDLTNLCDKEFDIYEWVQQPDDNIRLTYCYYHRWICTDTEVGIRVWYLDNKPVCISYQPYRKSSETFGWLSKDDFNNVREYVNSLIDEDKNWDVIVLDNNTVNDVIENFNSIEYKKFEEKNIK